MMLTHIDIDDDDGRGNVNGYVVAAGAEQLGNWLEEYTPHAAKIAAWVKENCTRIAIGKNLNVNEDHRGKGIGTDLFCSFMSRAAELGADIIVLISDAAEQQQDGFHLQTWYESQEFGPVTATNAGAFMVYPQELSERMKLELFPARTAGPKY
jgi:GNAT superfamily N-acetyltransferase